MTEQEIERCLERFTMGKATDVMNFDYAGTLAYIQRLKAENAELKSSLTHANEECLKWHERAQNLLKDSDGSISGYEKKISDLQAEYAALKERLDKAVDKTIVSEMLAKYFDCPCNFSPLDEEMWAYCRDNCVDDNIECWIRVINKKCAELKGEKGCAKT